MFLRVVKDYLSKVHENDPSRGLCNEFVTYSALGDVESCPHSVLSVELACGLVSIASFHYKGREHLALTNGKSVATCCHHELVETCLAVREEAREKAPEELKHDQLIRQWGELGLEAHSRK